MRRLILIVCTAGAVVLNGWGIEVSFTGVGYDGAGVNPGSVVISGTDTQTVFTVSDMDVDGDGTNDTFDVRIDISSSNGTISWDSGGGEYDHNGGTFSSGEEITLSFAGVNGTASTGSAITNGGFGFDTMKVKRFQGGESFSVAGDQTAPFTNTDNTAELAGVDSVITLTGVNGTWNLEYFEFTIRVGAQGVVQPPLPPTTANGKNLIWVITDEHNLRTLGCYRDTMPQGMAEMWGDGLVCDTPNLDAMADNGALFTRMHAARAVCTPSRASMFTGTYPLALGIPNNSNTVGDGKYLHADVTTIMDVLKDAGYLTAYTGKWHLGEGGKDFEEAPGGKWWQPYPEDDPTDQYGLIENRYMFNGGHSKWYGFVEDGLPQYANGITNIPTANGDPYLVTSTPVLDHYKTENGETFDELIHDAVIDGKRPFYADAYTTNVQFTTDWLADRVNEFITDFADGTYNSPSNTYHSFFHILSIPDPHSGDSVREPYSSFYAAMDFQLPCTWDNPNYNPTNPYALYQDNPSWMVADNKAEDLYNPTAAGNYTIQDKIGEYFGMVACIDENIGRIITHLEKEGVLENTILMFSADHGDLFGEHQRVNKGTPWDMSLRIPFIVVDGSQLLGTVTNTAPLVPRGIIVEQSGNTADWMETFLSLLDVNNIPDTHGRDLTPLFDSVASEDWNEASVQSQGWMASTDSRYKLVVDASSSRATWLFDMQRDPKEYTNYIDHAEYEGVVRKLAQAMLDYMDDHPEDVDNDRLNECNRLLSGWDRYAEVYGLNPDQSGDEDGDGDSDLDEYMFGSNPTDSNSMVTALIEVNPTNGWPSFTHRARHPVDPDHPYAAEWTTRLTNAVWNTHWVEESTSSSDPGYVEVRRTVGQDEEQLFFRLKADTP